MKELDPNSRVFTDVMMDASGYHPVLSFGLSVGLLMVRGCLLSSDSEDVAHILPELGHIWEPLPDSMVFGILSRIFQ